MKKIQFHFMNLKKKTNEKPKHVIKKKDIVRVQEIDARVDHVENSFKVITAKRTYKCVAYSKEDLQQWKDVLSP